MFREYILILLCLVGYFSASFFSCSNSSNQSDGGGLDDTYSGAEIFPEKTYPDHIVAEPEPYRKRTGSWAIGPRTLLPYSTASEVKAITTDSKGNVILAGVFAPKYGSWETWKLFVAKVGPDSVPLWIYQSPGDIYISAFDIKCDAQDNIYMTGIFSGDLHLLE